MPERSKEVDACLKRAAAISTAISETVRNNEEIIRTASWMNRKLAGSLSGFGFLTTACRVIPSPSEPVSREGA